MSAERSRQLLPQTLDRQQRQLYDAIVDGPRGGQANSVPLVDSQGGLEGPFNAFLLAPRIGDALQRLGATLRYESALDDRAREIAILVVAAHTAADFERYVHEPIAHSLGLSAEQLAGIRDGDYGAFEAHEALVARAAREMLESGSLADTTFSRLQALIGDAQVFELTSIVGYYALLALQLRVFQVPTPK